MNFANYPVQLRNDDVLQYNLWTQQGRKYLNGWREGGKTPFELFLEADKPFEKYQYPCILAVISDGIEHYPEWVDYIKQNKYRYQIELHGSSHYYYCELSEQRGLKELAMAKEKIEDTFETRITTWYVTFGKRKAPEWGKRVCDKLGIKYDIPNTKRDAELWLKNYYLKEKTIYPFYHINFHFWHPAQRRDVGEVVKILCEK